MTDHGSRYEIMRSAAGEIVAAYVSGWQRPQRPDERNVARLVNGFVIQLSIPHDATTPGCLCAGCRSTQLYAEAADLTSRSLDNEAAWRQRIGDAYFVAHGMALALGWQRPHVDIRGILAERDRWERSSPTLGLFPRGPLVT
jgi:hypothetical protein